MPAEWRFFVTSLGKSTCDWIGDTLKKAFRKASLQWPYNDQVMTPHQLYKWAQSNTNNICSDTVTENEYKEEEGLFSS